MSDATDATDNDDDGGGEDALVGDLIKKPLPLPVNSGAELLRFDSTNDTIGRVLNPAGGMSVDAFMVAAVTAANGIVLKDERTHPLDRITVARSVFNAATLGLSFGDALGQAYLVPFKDNRAKKTDCQLIVGYHGFKDLAFRTGFLRDLTTDVVLVGEELEIWTDETGRRIKHVPDVDRSRLSKEDIRGAYCVYQTARGGRGVTYLSKPDIAKRAKAYSDAWKFSFGSMAEKSAIRKASKEWQMSGEMRAAVHIDEMAEINKDVPDLTGEAGNLANAPFIPSGASDLTSDVT